uniref:Uncharacterized protein n=1 Tax=Candidatus Methanogaster sp. ANME-2c ERB4 TaxID=2759911 RepID=A0A7G9Y379_9EURY|nr:hypothetical protein LBOOMNCC_00016 [Methanosarcinales archaeon ANME-2c ERB4]
MDVSRKKEISGMGHMSELLTQGEIAKAGSDLNDQKTL